MKFTTLLPISLLTTLGLAAATPKPPISARQANHKYIFASFHSENEQSGNEVTWLDIYSSDNGIDYKKEAIPEYKRELSKGQGLIRDPSIINYQGKYYIAHTTGWSGDTIAIISSDDLQKWDPVTTVTLSTEGLGVEKAWAPELFFDPDGSSMNMIVSLQARQKLGKRIGVPPPPIPPPAFEPYILSAKAGEPLKEWNEPQLLDVKHSGGGQRQGHIDMFVIRKEDDAQNPYHGFMKNEHEKHVEHLVAPKLVGPWEFVQTNDFAGWGNREGPAVTTLPDGKYILFADDYHGTVSYAISSDLSNWEEMKPVPNVSNQLRHGTVLKQG